jgi:predicted nucleic acid-binding protein
MAKPVADTGFLVALLNERDRHHGWAREQAAKFEPPFDTCEAVLSETFHLLMPWIADRLIVALGRGMLRTSFVFEQQQAQVLTLMHKYGDVPMDFADACLVRMTELLPDPLVLTTDSDFRIYRRHSRQVVPCVTPT